MNNQTGSTQPPTNDMEEAPQEKKVWSKVKKSVGNWFAYKDKKEWLKDMRKNLSMMASIIATMTFQSAINPPGGVFQANPTDKVNGTHNNSTHNQDLLTYPGQAVLGVVYPDEYFLFLLWNTICFIASQSVCLLLVSGFPLHHRFTTWLLSIGMCITITSLGLTYLFAAGIVTLDPVWDQARSVFDTVLRVCIALLGIVGLVLVMRLFVWGFRKYKENCRSH